MKEDPFKLIGRFMTANKGQLPSDILEKKKQKTPQYWGAKLTMLAEIEIACMTKLGQIG